ncbi:MAG TPA: imidazole glycerol phosphate synthase subunit HisH, partial [Bacteroidota bacterium]|nr:imidazole glycerol phosphate synthase subunit HisH [Bacteroidota bacterium]
MITIVDYGMGNLRNVQRGLAAIGFDSEISSDPQAVGRARKVILPGVGAFGEAMKRIKDLRLLDSVVERARAGVPLLGI